jgi:Xaa-Pro dipeptidase
MEQLESVRIAGLLEAQNKAQKLFDEVAGKGIIHPGQWETEINEEIYLLARQLYGIDKYWHKRIVRAGPNTLKPYDENPPDLQIANDDIVFLDFGPVFEEWEADFGRTYVVGSDAAKLKLCRDIEEGFAKAKKYFHQRPDITASELYGYAEQLAVEAGWEYGGPIAGHLIGQFPHERIAGDKVSLYVHPENHLRMRDLDEHGRARHWILEIHFIDRPRQIGGFYEELLTVG